MTDYIYELEVLQDGTPSVCEEDIKLPLERLGYEAEVYNEDDGFFTICTTHRLNRAAIKEDIEALDKASTYEIRLELMSSS